MINRSTLRNKILIVVGVCGVFFFLGYDFFRPGVPEFGRMQFMGFIASVMMLLTGLRKLDVHRKGFWNAILIFIYFAGFLYLVLMPRRPAWFGNTAFMALTGFSKFDFILNVFGFMPFGYFLWSIFPESDSKNSQTLMFFLILAIGISASFLIESAQYFIPGRSSSFIDVAANGAGTIFGMLFYQFERLIAKRSH